MSGSKVDRHHRRGIRLRRHWPPAPWPTPATRRLRGHARHRGHATPNRWPRRPLRRRAPGRTCVPSNSTSVHQKSVDAAVASVLAEGRPRSMSSSTTPDTWCSGPTEAFTPGRSSRRSTTPNVLGTQRVNRAALPHLRQPSDGLVVWVGSSSTRGGTPPYLGPVLRGEGRRGRARRLVRRRAQPASTSRPRSSCPAPSPSAPTTSSPPATPPTKPSPRRTSSVTPG